MRSRPLSTVPIPAGSIQLRDARTQTTRTADLLQFHIAAYPVTWSAYGRISAVPMPNGEVADAPVHSVSWLDAVNWCNALSVSSGLAPAYDMHGEEVSWNVSSEGFRLPTEAEWEYACRAGSTGPRYGPLAEVAWSESDEIQSAQPVGQKRPNAYGLFDVLGNVWEWCWDYADTARYADYRVLRGGGWADKHWSVRASTRRGSMPGTRLDDLGFRVAQGAVGDSGDEFAQGWSRHADKARAHGGNPLNVGWAPLHS